MRVITIAKLLSFTISLLLANSWVSLAKSMVVISHRSASGYLPEHTLEGAAVAHSMGADFIEPDVVLTKDKIPIVLHDIYLEGTTDVEKKFLDRKRNDGHYYVIDFSLKEIKTLKVKERVNPHTKKSIFPSRFPQGLGSFSVPTLEELFELISGMNKSRKKEVGIYPEIKRPDFYRRNHYDSAKIIYDKIVSLKKRMLNVGVVIQCFESETLKRIREEFKDSEVVLNQLFPISDEGEFDYNKIDKAYLDQTFKKISKYANIIGPHYQFVLDKKGESTGFVDLAKHYKLKTHVYTLRMDQLPKYAKSLGDLVNMLKKIGVDGAFTDFTDLMSSAVK